MSELRFLFVWRTFSAKTFLINYLIHLANKMVIKQVCDLWLDKTVLQNNLHTKKKNYL